MAALLAGAASADDRPPYRDAALSIEARVQDLLARMTPVEKFWQLFMVAEGLGGDPQQFAEGVFGVQVGVVGNDAEAGDAGSGGDGGDAGEAGVSGAARDRINALQRHCVEDTRLGIPMIPFAEALHGLVQTGATSFPQAIGLAATFDTELMAEVAAAVAEECRSAGIRLVLSPVVNIASDVRWGRVEETYGEDPYLAAEMGVAFVSAFEQRGIVTTPKHFIANVGDGGRDSYPIHLSERFLREVHLPPFGACIQRGGARAVMTAYNSLDGTPCSAHGWLNRTLLRDELGFTGVVVSDAGAVGGANVLHFTARDYEEAGALALAGGLDVIFQTSPEHFRLFLPPFLDGRIAPDVIDRAVARVLRLKFALGLFDEPYAEGTWDRRRVEKHCRLARRAAQASIVLLKNEGGVLPLSETPAQIAVLGPDAAEARLGGYSGPGRRKVSILDGIRSRIGADKVSYARGCERLPLRYTTIGPEWLSCVQGDTLRQGLLGEYFANIRLAGSPASTRVDPRLQFQWTLFSPDPERLPYDFYSVRWTGTLKGPATGVHKIGIDGNDGYRLYLDGKLVIDNWRKVTRRVVLADFTFEQDRLYDLKIEYFEPTGNAWFRLVWDHGVSRAGDAELGGAVALAARSDVAIVVAGIEEGEFRDRAQLGLPGRQEELIERVAATGTPVVVVLVGGSAVTMSRWLERVPAVLDVWYPGEAGGEAVADVLFGDHSPSGRLPITFPVAEGQVPLVHNHKPTGRGDDYLDLTGQPLFPFGHGLSYTTFEYSDLAIEPDTIQAGEIARVRCSVRNTGARAGHEVVQMYLRDELASFARPITELKGFARVRLEPGEASHVSFAITPELLSMLNVDLKRVVEPGDVRVTIGASSKDIRLRGVLTLIP